MFVFVTKESEFLLYTSAATAKLLFMDKIPSIGLAGFTAVVFLLYRLRFSLRRVAIEKNTTLEKRELHQLRAYIERNIKGTVVRPKPYGALLKRKSFTRNQLMHLEKRFPRYRFRKTLNGLCCMTQREARQRKLFSKHCRHYGFSPKDYGRTYPIHGKVVKVIGFDIEEDCVLLFHKNSGSIVEFS